MYNLPPCRFRIGQRVKTRGINPETGELYPECAGTIKAVLYAEEVADWEWRGLWGRAGFTYFIQFDTPRSFRDDAHESELIEEGG